MMSDMVDINARAHDIKENLKKLNFDQEEIEVYIALLNEPILAVLEISKKTNIARTTVYRSVDSLLEKGAIEKIIEEHGKKYKAVHPNNFAQILENKKQEFETVKNSVEALSSMVRLPETELPRTQIRYYQGRTGMKQLIWNTLEARKDMYGVSLGEWVSLVGEKFLEKYSKEFKKRRISDWYIVNEKTVPRIVKKFQTPIHHQASYDFVRVMKSEDLYISGDTIIYNDVFATIFWKHGEIVGVEMENKELAKMQLGLFKIAWEQATPLQKYLPPRRQHTTARRR